MNLRDQIREISERRINPIFAKNVNWPTQVDHLAAKAFICRWYEEPLGEQDCRVIRYAYIMLHDFGGVPETEPPLR